MLADTELPLAKEPSLKDSFKAHFKHALLFNESLMISDAQAVNCVNLRELINTDNDFKQLMNPNLLSIAVRDPSGESKCHRLTQVRDAFQAESKQNMSDDKFRNDTDLDFLNESCDIIPYTYSSLRENYTNSIIDIFSGEKAREKFGQDTQSILIERLLIESERDNGLGRVFLHKNFELDLNKSGRHDIWERYREDIIKLSDAPYVTGISKVLSTNPIYSPLHKESFELAYPKPSQIVEKSRAVEISTDLNLSSYETALSKLRSDDIIFLRESYEFRQYQKLINSGISNEGNLDNTLDALIAYQDLIDQYIIKRHLGVKTSKQFKGKRFIEPMRKVAQEGSVFALGLALTDTLSGGALSIANFFLSEVISKNSDLSQSKILREKHKLQSIIEKSQNNNKIKAESIPKQNASETIYTSITSSVK
ncbi:hypothetical protein KUV89_00665 [Marinobacter hydrocarbonoclasticus]|nr:hypothetical protein [Marinobacter nauticus]